MPVTKEQCLNLKHGAILTHVDRLDSSKQPMRVRVSGKCLTLKRTPEFFRLPVKYGLYENGAIDNNNCQYWNLA